MKKILIADDTASSRELLRTVLETAGYDVSEASDGVEAFDLARRVQPDLVILDLHMPGLDGFGALGELRRDPKLAGIPAMALTASAMPADRQRVIEAGFDGYLTKPVPLPVLREEVVRLLAVAKHREP